MTRPTDWSALPLSRSATDRAAVRRSEPGLLDRLLAAPTTRVLLVRGGELALAEPVAPGPAPADTDDARGARDPRPDGTRPADAPPAPRLALLPASAAAGLGEHVLRLDLGCSPREDGTDVVAVVLPPARTPEVDIEGVAAPEPDEALGAGRSWGALRDLGHLLDAHDAGLATAAVALAAWHARSPRCPSCGEPTVPVNAGWARRCEDEGTEHYPRTDPAVIMAVVDADDRLLLGHAAHWPERRFSTLAGFVEAGEAAEAAVRREVLEETGVVVGRVEFRATQPWPFPASLMLGFVAHAETTTITTDDVEVTDARWFTREQLAADVAAGRVVLPMRSSIARALVEEWFGARIEDPAR